MSGDHWLQREVELLRTQNAELRARLEAIEADYGSFVLPGDELAAFTGTERSIVKILHDRGGRLVRKDGIHQILYGLRGDRDVPDIKIIDVLICRLRKKLTAWEVVTDWGNGYALRPKADAAEVAA